MKVRILIVEDHPLVRDGIKAMLGTEKEIEIIAQTSSGWESVHLAQKHNPDVILLDYHLLDLDGLQVLTELKRRNISSRVIFLTVHEDPLLIKEALRLGASGYLAKRDLASHLSTAIFAVRNGEVYVHPSLQETL